jgi:hypothetical protein
MSERSCCGWDACCDDILTQPLGGVSSLVVAEVVRAGHDTRAEPPPAFRLVVAFPWSLGLTSSACATLSLREISSDIKLNKLVFD